MIDTHAHIYLDDFKSDIETVISNARKNGIKKILMPNLEIETIVPMLKIESQFPDLCKSMLGLHPCYIKKNYQDQLAKIKPWLQSNKFVAIGEVGIDLYHSKELFAEQEKAFEEQIKWALEYNLPLAVHARNSFIETIGILEKNKTIHLKGVIHCFSGSLEEAQRVIDLGFKIGIGGVCTFKNSNLLTILKEIDLEHIILETDAPYLSPKPFRGKRNEPAYIYNIAQTIASIKEIDLEKISEITDKNACALFGL